MFVWHLQTEKEPVFRVRTLPRVPGPELIEVGTEQAVFDDVIELNPSEQMQFQELLEAAQAGAPRIQ